jgi:hypothetical protein
MAPLIGKQPFASMGLGAAYRGRRSAGRSRPIGCCSRPGTEPLENATELDGRRQVVRSSAGSHAVGIKATPSALAVVSIKGDGQGPHFCLCRTLPSLFFVGRDVVIVDRVGELTVCEVKTLPRDSIVEMGPLREVRFEDFAPKPGPDDQCCDIALSQRRVFRCPLASCTGRPCLPQSRSNPLFVESVGHAQVP